MGRIYIVTSSDPSILERGDDHPFAMPALAHARVFVNITDAHREARERGRVFPNLTFYVLRLETLTQHPAPSRRKTTGKIRKP